MNISRNRAILFDALNGKTFTALAKEHGICNVGVRSAFQSELKRSISKSLYQEGISAEYHGAYATPAIAWCRENKSRILEDINAREVMRPTLQPPSEIKKVQERILYQFSAIDKYGDETDAETQVLSVEVVTNRNSSDDLDLDSSLSVCVKSKINKEWVYHDFGLMPFSKESAIALRDFLNFCFPLKPRDP